jgi:N-glycosylase/DNA lyase
VRVFDIGLVNEVKRLKESEVKRLVKKRIREFKELGKKSSHKIFKELCFCILTANFNAERSMKIQHIISDGFLTMPETALAKRLKELGHRYPNSRAKYIVEARKYRDSIKDTIESFNDEHELREWLVRNVKGIGYKESSHFLRNIGYDNLAIIDFHIVNVLAEHGLIEKPKTLTKSKYLGIENLLRTIAQKSNLTLAELDLFLWYMETGKVLK